MQPFIKILWALVSSCDHELRPVILAIKLDLNMVKLNHHAQCLFQGLFRSKVIIQTPTHTHNLPITLPGLPRGW